MGPFIRHYDRAGLISDELCLNISKTYDQETIDTVAHHMGTRLQFIYSTIVVLFCLTFSGNNISVCTRLLSDALGIYSCCSKNMFSRWYCKTEKSTCETVHGRRYQICLTGCTVYSSVRIQSCTVNCADTIYSMYSISRCQLTEFMPIHFIYILFHAVIILQ